MALDDVGQHDLRWSNHPFALYDTRNFRTCYLEEASEEIKRGDW